VRAQIIALFSVFLYSFQVVAHEYYFGFAEMQYNPVNKTLEATIVLTAHDLELVLEQKGIHLKNLELSEKDSLTISKVFSILGETFTVIVGNQKAIFKPLGFEVNRIGQINIYIFAENINLLNSIDITFSTLMDSFPLQQNKLTFIHENNSYTAVFLPNKKSEIIKL
jgi:hypothetical protein